MDHHRWWVHVYGLDKTMWGVDIHETGMRALEQFGCYDGLDLPNSAGLEVILRQCQLAEYVYVQESGSNDQGKGKRGKGGGSKARAGLLDEASVFIGTHRDPGDADLPRTPGLRSQGSRERRLRDEGRPQSQGGTARHGGAGPRGAGGKES